MLAIQANGRSLRTVEGLAGPGGELTALQRAFTEHHALQCGFCTAGFLMTADALLRDRPEADEAVIRAELAGNLCRCTGYEGIVAAVLAARDDYRGRRDDGDGRDYGDGRDGEATPSPSDPVG
jgi:carbon-monoxide dehydrogenase small subunit